MNLNLRKYFQLKSRSLSRKAKLITMLLIMMLVAAAILIVNQEVIYHRIYDTLGKTLRDRVAKDTNGLYILEYDSLSINTIKQQVTLRNISFKIDSSRSIEYPSSTKNLYHVKAPALFLDITNIWDVVFDKKLEFNSISINDPELSIFNLNAPDSASNISFQSGKLYLNINKYLDEFNIKNFRLLNGSVRYKKMLAQDQREITIENIDAYVDNLSIDAENKTTGTDRIKVILKKPSFFLADGLHKLQMDSIILDSEDGRLILNELVVYPDYAKLREADIDQINIYNFVIPKIELEGIDFAAAYNDNKLLINRIYIPNPEITVDNHKKKTESTQPTKNNLSKLLSVLFNQIHADEFLLEDGKLDLALESDDKLRNIRIKNTTINIQNLDLDTLKYDRQSNHIHFETFNLKLENYHLILPDSLHNMTAETVLYNSDSNQLTIANVEIEPSDNFISNTNYFSAKIPLVKVDGLDFKKYLKDHSILVDQIEISNPEVVLYNNKSSDTVKKPMLNFALNNNKMADDIAAKNIIVNNIFFKLINKKRLITELTEGHINLTKFYLSEYLPGDPTTYFNSGNVKFHFDNVTYYTPNADEISITGLRGNIYNSNLGIAEIRYTSNENNINIHGTDILLYGSQIKKALDGEGLILDTLSIGNIKFSSFQSKVNTLITDGKGKLPIDIGYLRLMSGNINLDNGIFSHKVDGLKGYIENFKVEEGKVSYSDVKLSTKDLRLESKEKNILLGAASAEFTNKDLILHLPYLKPFESGKGRLLSLASSQISFLDVDFKRLINNKSLQAEQLKVLNANLKFHKDEMKKSPISDKRSIHIDWNKILADKLEEIIIDRVIISGPLLSLNLDKSQFNSESFEVELRKFNTNLDGRKHLLNSDNLRINTENVEYVNDELSVKVGEFKLDNNARLIALDNLEFEDGSAKIKIPVLYAKQLDLRKLAEENKLIGKELELDGFNISLKNEKKKNKNETAGKDSSLPIIHFDKVHAHQGLLDFKNENGSVFKMNGIKWQLSNFDTEKNSDKLFNADSFTAKAGSLTGLVKEGMDRLLITGLDFRNNGSTVHLENLYLKPEHSKLKYAYQVGHETDWVNLVVKDITIDEIDLKKLIKTKALIVKEVTAKELRADIYRDKKLPLPEKEYKPLPQEALRKMDTPLSIGKIDIRSADITYQELNESAFEPGELSFQDLHVNIHNITNLKSDLEDNKNMSVEVNGYIEGTSLFITTTFNLLSDKNEFIFSGQMGEGGLPKFNKILEKNVFLRIEKGESRGLTFNIKADDNYAMGNMKFYYKHLKVSVIDKQTNKTSGFDESIASFFANTFVIKSNNPSLLVVKEGDIYFERNKNKSIFNYWAKSFLNGIVSSIGVKNNKKEMKDALSKED